MRIAFIGPFAMQPKRTMAVRALPLARALAARGHEVLMLLPAWDHPEDAGWEWAEQHLRVYNVPLPGGLPAFFHLRLTWRLIRECLRFRPEVVHCFKPKSYAGLAAWTLWHLQRLGRFKGRLVVDADDWEGKGGWNTLARYTWLQKRFFAWQERWGLTHCDALTVASRALETIVWSLGVPPQRVHYLPNGWAGQADAPDACRQPELRRSLGLGEAPVALLYTRFFEFRLERALAIMQGALSAVPGLRWLVVGRGFFGEEQQLSEAAREAGIAECITYAGWVPGAEVPQYLALARVAIYPLDDTLVNRCKCAVKLIDLLSSGVPVVADRVGQNAEYILDGVSGVLVAPGDTPAFVAAVVRVLGDAQLAARLGGEARRRMRHEFAWERLVELAEEAYVERRCSV